MQRTGNTTSRLIASVAFALAIAALAAPVASADPWQLEQAAAQNRVTDANDRQRQPDRRHDLAWQQLSPVEREAIKSRSVEPVVAGSPDAIDRYLRASEENSLATGSARGVVAGSPDAIDRYLRASEEGAVATGTTPGTPASVSHLAGYESFRSTSPIGVGQRPSNGTFAIDWPSVGIGAGFGLATAFFVVMATAVARGRGRVAHR